MKSKKSIQETIQKEMPEFVEAVVGLSVDELNSRLAALAKDHEAVQDSKDADRELEQARELAKELNGPYVDAKKTIRLKNKYLVSLIKEKGVA